MKHQQGIRDMDTPDRNDLVRLLEHACEQFRLLNAILARIIEIGKTAQ